MLLSAQNLRELINECDFSASKSSGPGGQHVNKTNTKVELRFNIEESVILTHEQKHTLLKKLSKQITNTGYLVMIDQSSRSQLKNKQAVINRFTDAIQRALRPRKKRIATKPTKASKQKRIEQKKRHSEKKALRKGPFH